MPRLTNAAIRTVARANSWSPQPRWIKTRLILLATAYLLGPSTGRGDEPLSPTAHAPAPTIADVETVRTATTERLKALRPAQATAGAPGSSTKAAAKPPLLELFEERLRLLDEYEIAYRALNNVTHVQPSPERQSADARDELRELEAVLSRAARDPATLLPPLFLRPSVEASRTLPAEMKAALETTSNELKEGKSRLETLKSEIAKSETQQNSRRADREKLFQGLATLKAQAKDFDLAVRDAPSVDARQLARERQINFEWRTSVKSIQLQVRDAELALEAKLIDLRTLKVQVARSQIHIAVKTLAQMNARYRAAALDQESRLRQAAAEEDEKARQTKDPVELFRARRSAELFRLETVVLKYEQALATNPSPSEDEQKTLADRADEDFARIKKLLDDGSVSRLDAIRLNNEFRRIAPERDRLLKNELATVEAQIQFYENALTNVEIDLIEGSNHEYERDLVRDRLPASRWGEGEAVLDALEKRHRGLLVRQRDALESLTIRGGHTLHEVLRRVDTLDEEYGFIRTNIFWVRDQEPIGPATLAQELRELHYLAKGVLRLVQEWINPKLWGQQPSAEFLAASLGILALPVGLVRLRRSIRVRIERDLSAP